MAVLSAGTADESVAEECRVIADYMGCYTFKLPDVSVDGLHRILHNLPGLLWLMYLVVLWEAHRPCIFCCLLRAKLHMVNTISAQAWRAAQHTKYQVVTLMCTLFEQRCRHVPYIHCTDAMCWIAAVRAADVIVVVSGTDGALPSVVAGLVETPVVSPCLSAQACCVEHNMINA